MKNIKSLKRVIFATLVVAILLLLGVSTAWYQLTIDTLNDITLVSGTLELTFVEGDSVINLEDALPTSDSRGLSMQPYTFTVKNTGNVNSSYTIYLEDILIDGTRMDDKYVKYSLTKEGDTDQVSLMSSLANSNDSGVKSRILTVGNLDVDDSVTYNLKVWISEDAPNEAMGTEFSAKIKMQAEQKRNQSINNPILTNGMIPVIYNGRNWIKADSDNSNNSWYNYNEQRWANAVTLYTDRREAYESAPVGTIISDVDINSFFVWIPRYSYTIASPYGTKLDGSLTPTVEYPGAIDVKFIQNSITDTGSGSYTGNKPSEYYTPVGFCFGDTCDTSRSDSSNVELSGVWVSKFEVTGSLNDITSIPNAPSLRNIEVSKFFNAILKNMNGTNGTNNYGLSGNYDAHMIKNSEWSLITYLAQSKYGKYGNSDYTGTLKAITPNTSTSYMTGNGDGAVYNEEKTGTGASTTGNIYGIYDTVGGSYEYVMGNLNNLDGGAKFENFPSRKYYDLYTNSGIEVACNNTACRGQNLNSTLLWYNSSATFLTDSAPWLMRGGSNGLFGIDANIGINNNGTTRVSVVSW